MSTYKRFKTLAIGLLSVLTVLGLVATAVPQATQAQSIACQVDYNNANDWGSGATINVTINNNGSSAIDGWTLEWDFPGNQQISHLWNGSYEQSGASVSVSNASWNGTIGTNGSVNFGFNLSYSGTNDDPTGFTLNGVTCGDDVDTPTATNTSETPTDTPTATNTPETPTDTPTATNTPQEPTNTPTATSTPETPTDTPTATNTPQTPTDTPTATNTPSTGGQCAVGYTVNQWNTSFTAEVTITNNGDPISGGWTLTWSFSDGQQVTSAWNVNVTQSGANVTATDSADWNANIPTGGSQSFGFQATHTGINSPPTDFALNGVSCGEGGDPTPTPTATPTDDPTSTPTATPTDGPTPTPTNTPTAVPPGYHVDNPYEGAIGYVNPEWSAKAAAEPGGSAVANISTGVWLDRIAAIEGTDNSQSNGPMGLRDHLDVALEQGGGQPIVAQIVIYNLPNRDCSALASNGELRISEDGLNIYKTEYIDPIAEIMSDPMYESVRIVAIIEIDSLPNLVTNLDAPDCQEAYDTGAYVQGVQYALDKLHAIPNVYTYVDAAHHGWIGWDDNFNATAQLFADTAQGTIDGFDSVDGFITNTANYSALQELYFSVDDTVNGQLVRQSTWVDWNRYIDELSFAQAFRNELVSRGFSPNLGMLIDTSRNGWGGSNRPTGPSSSTDLNTFVDESRIDRRIHAGNWCNQSGAGLGERPTAAPESGIDAYVWIKPPGESDGSSEYIPNDDGKGFDQMCDPTYTGNNRNGNNLTGALPDAPISGAWFSAQFQELVQNAYPPIE